MRFEWDAKKNDSNIAKHGLSFEDAHFVFEGDALTVPSSYRGTEPRELTVGLLLDVVVTVVHTQRGEAVRVISMRKANGRETKLYRQRHDARARDEG